VLNLLALVALVLLLLARPARAQEVPRPQESGQLFSASQAPYTIALDLFVFSQADQGGNPLVDEGFRYQALGLELRGRISEQVGLRATGVLAYLNNAPLQTLPGTIANANVTSASLDFTTLDATLALDWTSGDRRWKVTPGFFYHHQWAYIAGGIDLDVRHTLAGGDTVLRASYGGRYAGLRQKHWDGAPMVDDVRLTHNAVLGWTQTLSPGLVASLGLQYTRQDGLLHSTLQFVSLHDADGAPVQLVDEVLPRVRNRVQVNLRGRYTPWPGTSVGLDLGAYYDDWALLNLAVEPSLETPLPWGLRFRVWYRLAGQHQTRYFVTTPTAALPFMTQNPSLGSFLLHGPGVTLLLPLEPGKVPRWLLRASALGFYRSDQVFGAGVTVGLVAEW
jgi:hypothetical protein